LGTRIGARAEILSHYKPQVTRWSSTLRAQSAHKTPYYIYTLLPNSCSTTTCILFHKPSFAPPLHVTKLHPPSKPRASPLANFPPSSPITGEEQRLNTQPTKVGFGNRRVAARNLAPTVVPPPALQPIGAAVGSITSEAAASMRKPAHMPPKATNCGWAKGTYRSPYDYNTSRHVVGGKNSPSVQSFPVASPLPDRVSSVKAHDTHPPEMSVNKTSEMEHIPVCQAVTPGLDVGSLWQLLNLQIPR